MVTVTENEIAKHIVDAAFKIHTTLGPGLFESVYEAVMAQELARRGLHFIRQQAVPVVWENMHLEAGFRADLIVENKVIVEIKSVEEIARRAPKAVADLPSPREQAARNSDQF
jgi:GxxExxY protein